MTRRFESSYRMKDGTTRLGEAYFNGVFRDLDLRLHSQEEIEKTWQAAIQELNVNGLRRIDEFLIPAYQNIADLSALGFLSATLHDDAPVTFNVGEQVVIVSEGPERDLFQPSPYVTISVGGDTEKFAVARTLQYDRETGAYAVDILSRSAALAADAGPHTDIHIAASAGSLMATRQFVEEGEYLRAQTEALRDQAQQQTTDAITEAVAARDLSGEYRDQSREARDESERQAGISTEKAEESAESADRSEHWAHIAETSGILPPAAGHGGKFLMASEDDEGGVEFQHIPLPEPFVGVGNGEQASSGLVPEPQDGDDVKFLRGDGTWGVPSDIGFKQIETFDQPSAFDWVVPATGRYRVYMTGGGGSTPAAGGFGPSSGAGGGGYAYSGDIELTAGDVIPITVGGPDGTSSFGALLSATAGQPGVASSTQSQLPVPGGDGGIGIGGTVNEQGAKGGSSGTSSSHGGGGGGAGRTKWNLNNSVNSHPGGSGTISQGGTGGPRATPPGGDLVQFGKGGDGGFGENPNGRDGVGYGGGAGGAAKDGQGGTGHHGIIEILRYM